MRCVASRASTTRMSASALLNSMLGRPPSLGPLRNNTSRSDAQHMQSALRCWPNPQIDFVCRVRETERQYLSKSFDGKEAVGARGGKNTSKLTLHLQVEMRGSDFTGRRPNWRQAKIRGRHTGETNYPARRWRRQWWPRLGFNKWQSWPSYYVWKHCVLGRSLALWRLG